jgi:hypothetical protein
LCTDNLQFTSIGPEKKINVRGEHAMSPQNICKEKESIFNFSMGEYAVNRGKDVELQITRTFMSFHISLSSFICL